MSKSEEARLAGGEKGLPVVAAARARATATPYASVVYASVATSEAARLLLFPSLWLLVEQCGGEGARDQGLAAAVFCAGGVLSSPLLGHLADWLGGPGIALALSNSIIALGCILYLRAESFSELLAAQFALGLGSGSVGVARAVFAASPDARLRSEHLARLTAVQVAALGLLPVLGSLLSAWAQQHPSGLGLGLGLGLGSSSSSSGGGGGGGSRLELVVGPLSLPALLLLGAAVANVALAAAVRLPLPRARACWAWACWACCGWGSSRGGPSYAPISPGPGPGLSSGSDSGSGYGSGSSSSGYGSGSVFEGKSGAGVEAGGEEGEGEGEGEGAVAGAGEEAGTADAALSKERAGVVLL